VSEFSESFRIAHAMHAHVRKIYTQADFHRAPRTTSWQSSGKSDKTNKCAARRASNPRPEQEPMTKINRMTNRITNRITLCLGAAAVAAFTLGNAPNAAAAEGEDRFVLRLGALNAEAESRIQGRAEFLGDTYEYQSDRFEFGNKAVPRVEGTVRLAERHRLQFNYVRYDESARETLGEDVSFDNTTFPAGSSAELDARFDLGSVSYDFAVVETPTVSVGLQIGAMTAGLRGRLEAESGGESFRVRESERGTAPVVGARFSTNTVDGAWRFVAQGQYLDADWGDFGDYKGDVVRANALVEYRFTPSFGAFVGYDWFELDISRQREDVAIGLEQRFHGPMAGLTVAF
jgi:hypothetical protein